MKAMDERVQTRGNGGVVVYSRTIEKVIGASNRFFKAERVWPIQTRIIFGTASGVPYSQPTCCPKPTNQFRIDTIGAAACV